MQTENCLATDSMRQLTIVIIFSFIVVFFFFWGWEGEDFTVNAFLLKEVWFRKQNSLIQSDVY